MPVWPTRGHEARVARRGRDLGGRPSPRAPTAPSTKASSTASSNTWDPSSESSSTSPKAPIRGGVRSPGDHGGHLGILEVGVGGDLLARKGLTEGHVVPDQQSERVDGRQLHASRERRRRRAVRAAVPHLVVRRVAVAAARGTVRRQGRRARSPRTGGTARQVDEGHHGERQPNDRGCRERRTLTGHAGTVGGSPRPSP